MEFNLYIHQVIAIAFVPPAFVRLAWSGLQENSPDFDNKESFVQYFESTWIDGNFPICSWNVYKSTSTLRCFSVFRKNSATLLT